MTLRKKKKNTCCLSHLVPSTICDAYPYGVLQDATSLLSESLSSSFERAPLQKVSLGSRRYMRIWFDHVVSMNQNTFPRTFLTSSSQNTIWQKCSKLRKKWSHLAGHHQPRLKKDACTSLQLWQQSSSSMWLWKHEAQRRIRVEWLLMPLALSGKEAASKCEGVDATSW